MNDEARKQVKRKNNTSAHTNRIYALKNIMRDSWSKYVGSQNV